MRGNEHCRGKASAVIRPGSGLRSQNVGDRERQKSGLATSHSCDPTAIDGILDRLVHNARRIDMRGESMRKKRSAKPTGLRGSGQM